MLPPGVTLFHVRHGETDWNAEGRLQGRHDTRMNPRGLAQAEANGQRLRAHFEAAGIAPARLRYVASPLGRARRTMEIVRTVLGLPPGDYVVDDRLLEIDFGAWSGFTLAELRARGEADQVKARKRDKWGFRPPGGESYRDLSDRVAAVMEEIGEDTLIASHGGIYRAIHGLLLGTPPAEVPMLDARQDRVARFAKGTHAWL